MDPKNNRLKKKPPVFTGPRERFGQMLVRIRQLEGNPHYIAMGLGLGIFVSITPIIPLQTLVAIALAYLFRGSKSAAALGTWLSNPLTIPLVYYANYKLGCLLLGYQTTLDSITFDSFSQLMALGIDVTWAMLVGGVVIGAILGILAYFITFRIFVTIRRNTQSVDPESGMAA
ncbi:DUF2062 domain-containing protein [Desulfosarcina ovata]|nr:DUF2062 domain-containing protein [Desulfosarcina ovata]